VTPGSLCCCNDCNRLLLAATACLAVQQRQFSACKRSLAHTDTGATAVLQQPCGAMNAHCRVATQTPPATRQCQQDYLGCTTCMRRGQQYLPTDLSVQRSIRRRQGQVTHEPANSLPLPVKTGQIEGLRQVCCTSCGGRCRRHQSAAAAASSTA